MIWYQLIIVHIDYSVNGGYKCQTYFCGKNGEKMIKSVGSVKQINKNITEKDLKDMETTYIENKDSFLELVHLIELLKDRNILPLMNSLLSKQENRINSDHLETLKKGITKGFEEAATSVNTGKDLTTFQMMKLLKDPDINRAVSFFASFLKGLGKNIKDM